MKSKPVAFMLADLGVTKTHSRPHVSNGNPYIESLFKTTKYRPDFLKHLLTLGEQDRFAAPSFGGTIASIAIAATRSLHHVTFNTAELKK